MSIFLSGVANAALSEISFSGAISAKSEVATSLKIIMGKAAPTGFTGCGNETCDSCTGLCAGVACAPGVLPDACNRAWVSDTAFVNFNFKSATAGFAKITGTNAGTATIIKGNTTQSAANTSITLQVRWSEICQALTGTSVCADHAGTVTIGVGADQTTTTLADSATVAVAIAGTGTPNASTCNGTDYGMCDFTLFRGDQKAFINEDGLVDNGNIPTTNTGGLKLAKSRFYFYKTTEADCTNAVFNNNSEEFKELSIVEETGTSFLDSDIIGGLENGILHCFRAASVDEAGNIGYWTQTTRDVVPEEVVGFFTEENNCFVATAAYGSIMDPHVQTFRDFRDQVLQHFSLGRAFVGYYYSNAYRWARVIRENETLKHAVRLALWPLWLFAKLSVMFSWQLALFLFAAPLLGIVFLTGRLRDSKSRSRFAKTNFLILLALTGLLLAAASTSVAATPDASAKRQPAQETPPPEYPFPGAKDEEDDTPTPLKSPTAKKKARPAAKVPADPEVVRISKEGVYYYKRKASPQRSAFSFRVGTFAIGEAYNPESDLYFDDIYSSQGTIVFFDYEFQLIRTIGKLGIKVGSGLYVSQGTGRFLDDKTEAREQYTFVLFPNNISAIYRAQYWENQIIVPFAEIGAGYYTFAEIRDDRERTKKGGVQIGQFAVGGSLLLDFLDSAAMVEMDEDHGVNHLYLTGEFRAIKSFKEEFDITNNMVSFGFLFEF